jgi:hypothetical protein
VKNLTSPLSGTGLAVAIVLAYGCSANHVIGTVDVDGGVAGAAGAVGGASVTGAAGVVGAAGGGTTAGAGGAGGLAGRGTVGGVAGSGDSAGAAGGTSGVSGSADASGTGGTGGASGTACGFPMPNPASAGLPNPASYIDNHDGTVTDNVTGFTWQGTVDQLRYTRVGASAYCANKVPVGSWRLPTRLELVSLVDFTATGLFPPFGPTINQTYFPNTPNSPFWTSSAYAGAPVAAWSVSFLSGYTAYSDVTKGYGVRCVSGAPKCHPTRYQVQAGGLVLDRTTGLTWQQTIDAGSYSWATAKVYCAGLGAGWRLPSLTELQTIVDETKVSPSIDGTAFPSTPPGVFWTSSADAGNPGDPTGLPDAWYVDFNSGNADVVSDLFVLSVRCVR